MAICLLEYCVRLLVICFSPIAVSRVAQLNTYATDSRGRRYERDWNLYHFEDLVMMGRDESYPSYLAQYRIVHWRTVPQRNWPLRTTDEYPVCMRLDHRYPVLIIVAISPE